MSLIKLICDLIESPEVRKRFNSNPLRTAKEPGYDVIDAAKLSALFSMDPAKIALEITSELTQLSFKFMEGEFPPCSHLYDEDAARNVATPEYPGPTPKIYRIEPLTAKAADGDFELSVYGQSFSPDAQIEVKRQGSGAALVVAKHKVFGTFRCSQAYGMVTPVAGTYDVFVTNSPGGPHATTVASKLTLSIT